MARPTCVNCRLFMRCAKNEVTVIEGFPMRMPDGKEEWRPYKMWAADLWRCAKCGFEVITGYARAPWIEGDHDPKWQDPYNIEKVAKADQLGSYVYTINDC